MLEIHAVTTLRGAANLVFTGAFTATYASYAMAKYAVTRDRDGFRENERVWASVLAKAWGMEVVRFGGDDLDEGPCIFVANHQSQVDIIALLVALPRVPGFLAKKELRNVPVFGKAMEMGGHVFVDRSKNKRALAAVEDAARTIRDGASVVVFPEGTRSAEPIVRPFKTGSFHLAIAANVPVVPIGIRGTRDILPKHSKTVVAGRAEVHIGRPISPAAFKDGDASALMDRVRNEVGVLSELPLAQP